MIDRVVNTKVLGPPAKNGNKYYKYTFKYIKDDKEVTDLDTLNRISKLVIKIAIDPTDYLQVSGLDKNGKTQYIYHPLFITLTDQDKYVRLKHFCQKIHLLFDRIKKIKRDFKDKDFIIGLMFRLLSKTHIRIGNDCYVYENSDKTSTYGLTTLENRHVTINGSEITLDFIGKKNIRNKVVINSVSLAKDITQLKTSSNLKKDRLFKTTDGSIIKSSDMNSFLCESINSQEFSCKDFRTYASNILFIKNLSNFNNKDDLTAKEIEQNIKAVFKDVSTDLNHSEAISKGSYVIPHILDRYKENPSFFKKNLKPVDILIKLL